MITVGILDNVQLLKAEKNEHGSLVLTMDQAGGSRGSNIFDELNDTSDRASDSGPKDFIIWPYKYDEYTKTPEDMLKQMKRLKASLNHILKGYMHEDAMQKVWNAYAGINMPATEAERLEILKNDKVVAKIYDNQATQFITAITPHIGVNSPLFRVKFLRQSEYKAFPVLPNFAHFWEPMDVPRSQSKLSFSPYELGYREGDPEGKPSAWSRADGTIKTDVPPPDSTPATQSEAEDVEEVFGLNKDLGI
jgi:hypothetical protein